MTHPRRLSSVRGTSKRDNYDHRCRVAVQAVMEGMQEVRVQAVTPLAGSGHGQIAIRIGRVLIYLNDRQALESLQDACQQASEHGDKAFGVVLPPVAYRRR